MKKFLKSAICIMALLSVLSLAGCGEKTVKFGVGSYTSSETKDSADGVEGKSATEVTVATVLLDSDGKIADCAIDAIDIEAKFNQKGEAADLGELKSKYQMGDSYGMKEYGKSKGEWYEEVNSFIGVIKGKSLSDVKALVSKGKKGTDEVINAGCTIEIDDFVMAIEKAFNNAKELEAKKDNKVELSLSTKQTKKQNATNEAHGEVNAQVSYEARLVDKSKKTVKSYTDSVNTSAKFDNTGKNID